MFQEAVDNPAEENVFKQLRLNMWVSSLTRFIPEQIYDLGNEPINMEALKGRDCYGGLDLSSTGDITAFVLMFPPRDETEKYVMLPFFWVPEDTIPIRVRRASVLTTTSGTSRDTFRRPKAMSSTMALSKSSSRSLGLSTTSLRSRSTDGERCR